MIRALSGLAGSRERAEDALQEAVVDALRSEAVGGIERADAWLYVVAARHLHRGRLRAKLESALSTVRRSAPPPAVDRVATLELLGGLSRRQREIVIARFYLDLSYAELAAQFGISVGTATSTVTQSLKKIRRRLEANPEELNAWKTGN